MKIIFYTLVLISFMSCQNSQGNQVSEHSKTTIDTKQDINYKKPDTLTKTSTPFVINNINCYWEFTVIIYEGEPGGEGVINLKKNNTDETILSNSDYYNLDFFNAIDKNNFDSNGMFKDANFDKNEDFIVYSKTNSGNGGRSFNVYLFDETKGLFELSEKMSGGEFEIDKINKTISTYWKMGVGWNSTRVHHFDDNGNIKYTQITTRKVIPSNPTDLLQITNEKTVNGKRIEIKIDTTKFEGY